MASEGNSLGFMLVEPIHGWERREGMLVNLLLLMGIYLAHEMEQEGVDVGG